MSRLLKKIDEYIERRDNLKRKVDINMVPEYSLVVNNFETEDFKKLAVAGLEAAPLQFWIMPAAMSKKVHHSSEHGIGEVEYDEVNKIHYVKKIGGKAFHTLRVLDIAEIFMEADDPRVRNFRGNVIDTKKGNEMTQRERDLIRTACLWHDIYSGGPGDEFNSKRRSMDKDHPHYHRTELASLSRMVSVEEWDLLLKCIEQHMWKWDNNIEIVKFHDIGKMKTVREAYEFAKEYRIIRIVELSDLIASRNIRT
jgi:hypothetical protein